MDICVINMMDVHFMAEMCAGILVAVTDYNRFDGALFGNGTVREITLYDL